MFNARRKKAKEKLDRLLEERTDSDEKMDEFKRQEKMFTNERIGYMVKGINASRLIENNGELIQKIYPIYSKNEKPQHPLDFRTIFYYPEKYFAGIYIDTKLFNVLVIWSMTLFLFIAVYFDWLRKLVGGRDFR